MLPWPRVVLLAWSLPHLLVLHVATLMLTRAALLLCPIGYTFAPIIAVAAVGMLGLRELATPLVRMGLRRCSLSLCSMLCTCSILWLIAPNLW